MKTRTIIAYSLAAMIVLIVGAFSGWYFFLKTQSQTTATEDAARGYTITPRGNTTEQSSQTSEIERAGFFSRLLSSITGSGTGVSEPLATILTSDISGFSETSAPTSTSTSVVATQRPAQLLHVHTKPVAGMAFISIGGSELLRYVERSSGNIFEANPETGLAERLTNTLVPKIYEVSFTPGGRIIERSLDAAGTIVTTVGSVSTSTSSATSSMMFSSIALPPHIKNITFDPKTGALLYFIREASGVAGIRAEWSGAKPKKVFASTIVHWRPQWLSDGRIILTQNASDDIPGYAYEMKADGTLTSLVRAVPGLTTLPRAGGALLYGQSSGGVLALFVQTQGSAPIRLQMRTIADKCVWSSEAELIAYCGVPQGVTPRRFLDEWYRGATHSSDALWRINATTGSAEIVYTPGTSIDMENLTVSSAGTHIAFMNATDKSLWLLRLAEE
ncbi:hypothetical protein COU18_00275 [Candidatus Kaiserbacteria bacterium CG10_big_fil_rev_8_21_14_0_10_51_14]|uniref:Uncharacterized protein n=1 Tax=Candidatus Kaiserbacteria bacterium CG10_big_fil_rev_8_21_14_0_10_51_14 TaxID=1974610 RepID=A0A2H0UCM3_9BACT|nr:MAG: hypothetical protein COU18_00275 [Candidatus Kaiserbacteria bacterium CG10_big_fil_rev_8_21_14_0_10_51_14]